MPRSIKSSSTGIPNLLEKRFASTHKSIITDKINTEPLAKIDYVEVVDWKTLEPVETIDGTILTAIAVYIGKTRLIDNFIIE